MQHSNALHYLYPLDIHPRIINSRGQHQKILTLERQTSNSSENSDTDDCEIMHFSEKLDVHGFQDILMNKDNQYNRIDLERIKSTRFYNLKVLNLSSVMLVSVEQLVKINAMELQELILTDNQILRVAQIPKIGCGRLKKLEWDVNFTKECGRMAQGNWSSLANIKFDRSFWSEPTEDLTFLLKLQTKQLQPIQFSQILRILPKTLHQKIKSKYSQ